MKLELVMNTNDNNIVYVSTENMEQILGITLYSR